MTLLIVYPNIHADTRDAYQGLKFNQPKSQNIIQLIEGIKKQDLTQIADNLYNQFEETQFVKHPVIKEIKEKILSNGAIGALMSGSGSSLFGIFESKSSAEKAMAKLEPSGYRLFIAETIKT